MGGVQKEILWSVFFWVSEISERKWVFEFEVKRWYDSTGVCKQIQWVRSILSQLIESEKNKANRFEYGLGYKIRSRLCSHLFDGYKDVLERTLKVESNIKRLE